MVLVSMKQLLEAGVHFGHQTRRWNPKMAPYIFGERNGIHIIDLQKTVKKLKEAYQFVKDLAAAGGSLLFVGTKKQAQDAIREEAERCGMFYVNHRWLGGMLTNFTTIRKSVGYLRDLERLTDEEMSKRSKKEQTALLKEKAKLQRSLAGIKEMNRLPGALFIIDTRKEKNAVQEARKLGVPVVAVVDTNCDPDEIDYPIPGNDDAIRAVKLMTSLMAQAVLEGRSAELEGREPSTAPPEAAEDLETVEPLEGEKPQAEEMAKDEILEEEIEESSGLDSTDVEHLAGDADRVAAIATDYTDRKVERIRSKRGRDE